MKLKVPPALVFLFFGGVMYFTARFLPVGYFDFFGRERLAEVLLIVAVVISFLALFQFYKKKTTVDPMNPSKASQLVKNGVYRYSRNPMYLAMLLLLLAFGLKLGNVFNTLVAAFFVAYMNKFQIIPEEEALNKIFGKAYKQYCIEVRRWF